MASGFFQQFLGSLTCVKVDHFCTTSRPRPAPIPRSSWWNHVRPRPALLHLGLRAFFRPHLNSTQPHSVNGTALASDNLLLAFPGNVFLRECEHPSLHAQEAPCLFVRFFKAVLGQTDSLHCRLPCETWSTEDSTRCTTSSLACSLQIFCSCGNCFSSWRLRASRTTNIRKPLVCLGAPFRHGTSMSLMMETRCSQSRCA